MAYDVHIVRTRRWLDASKLPIEKSEVDALIQSDPELSWSKTSSALGTDTGVPAIEWKGAPCFWWHRNQIVCCGPDKRQLGKLVRMAVALGAYAVGDDGEHYELQKRWLGRDRLVAVSDAV